MIAAARFPVRSLLAVAGIIGVLLLSAWLVAGGIGIAFGAFLLFVSWLTTGRLSSQMIMRLHRAHPLVPAYQPELYRTLATLAERAGLPRLPRLYRLGGGLPGSFTIGDRHDAAIGVSDALLRLLDGRELTAVLAHEVAHVAANDVALMRFGEHVRHLTSLLCGIGLMAVLLVLMLDPETGVSGLTVLALVLAPTGVGLLQLALSRSREFAADEAAAAISGDPLALVGALRKLEAVNRWTLRNMFGYVSGFELPPLLRSHPATGQRIAALERLAARMTGGGQGGPWGSPPAPPSPHRRIFGG